MLLSLFVYALILAFCLAKLEINIEGKNGWAQELPTWRKKNIITDFFFGGSPLTGYHLWLNILMIGFFHIPFFVGLPWSFSLEIQIIAAYIFFMTVEDFLWFILNPAYGFSKFNKEHVKWHKKWIIGIPEGYIKSYAICALLLLFVLFIH